MALTRLVNGVRVPLTAQEETDQIAKWAANENAQQVQQAIDNAMKGKKEADVAALGTRAEMQAEAAAANSVPALRDLVLKLAEIIYSNENSTID